MMEYGRLGGWVERLEEVGSARKSRSLGGLWVVRLEINGPFKSFDIQFFIVDKILVSILSTTKN
jgi:hypothetical protein